MRRRIVDARVTVLACLLIVATPSCGSAATWRFITQSSDGLMKFYGDPRSVVRKGDAFRVRLLFDYREVQQDPDTLIEHRSTIENASVDCRGRRIAAIDARSYSQSMGKGRIVSTNERVAPTLRQYVRAAPDSVDDKVVAFVCERRNGTKRNISH